MVDSVKFSKFPAPPCTRCRTSALERTERCGASTWSNCWGPISEWRVLENILKNTLLICGYMWYVHVFNMCLICFSDDLTNSYSEFWGGDDL
jgi:hypothetical protein